MRRLLPNLMAMLLSGLAEAGSLDAAGILAGAGDLPGVSDLTSKLTGDLAVGAARRTVGISGRSLPEGLVKRGNPYETWSSYHQRVEGDRRSRLVRQKRSVDGAHSRQKRYLSFPVGSLLYLEPNIYLPIYRSTQLFNYVYAQYTMGWIIPRSVVVGKSAVNLARLYGAAETTIARWRLPVNTNTSLGLGRTDGLSGDRGGIFQVAARGLDKFGMDGKACLLRAICEVAAYPMDHDGLLGEIMSIVLSASRGATDDGELDPYVSAEYQGRSQGDCHATYSGCPVSMFNLL